jgi:hypothetical protein
MLIRGPIGRCVFGTACSHVRWQLPPSDQPAAVAVALAVVSEALSGHPAVELPVVTGLMRWLVEPGVPSRPVGRVLC